ncbi:hypothetical protein PFISCL1PPCAC_1480, partial [Pristionchus fissidentatus]
SKKGADIFCCISILLTRRLGIAWGTETLYLSQNASLSIGTLVSITSRAVLRGIGHTIGEVVARRNVAVHLYHLTLLSSGASMVLAGVVTDCI